ncbi:MAG: alcohol dehydrogenase catalytic domain-containing protein [Firmicutes bacterium]|nr:alcohol dehydrogenase catalytic domain-containing protein [Bacillota bacterium]
MNTIKAFIFDRPGCGQVETVELREPAPDEVLLKVEACGVCGTDVHIWAGTEPAAGHVILGHEFAGEIVEIGDQVTGYDIGDRVAVDPNIACGTCPACREGRVNLCSSLKALGVDIDGGFAEYCLVPARQLYRLDEKTTWEEAVMVEPLACALHGIDRAQLRAGQSVLVIGGGPIGLLMLQLARLQGAGRLALSEKSSWRRSLGLKYGADVLYDPANGRLADQIPVADRP